MWLRKVVRVAAVGKAMVKWALTWLATGRAAGQGLARLGEGVAAALGVV